ncbi:MAG: hypothetical protein AABY22_07580 [Nanoarchaeota archaeon]
MENRLELVGKFDVTLDGERISNKKICKLLLEGNFTGQCDYLESEKDFIVFDERPLFNTPKKMEYKEEPIFLECLGFFEAFGLPPHIKSKLKGIKTFVELKKPISYIECDEDKKIIKIGSTLSKEYTPILKISDPCSHLEYGAISNFWGATTFCKLCGKSKGEIDRERDMAECWQCKERGSYCPLHGLFAPL